MLDYCVGCSAGAGEGVQLAEGERMNADDADADADDDGRWLAWDYGRRCPPSWNAEARRGPVAPDPSGSALVLERLPSGCLLGVEEPQLL